MFRPYVRLLRVPGAALPALASFVGALPIGMLTLSVLLFVRSSTGSFALAGAVSGALTAGNAIGLLLQGRLIDRYGQPRVLVPTGLGCLGSLVLLVISAKAPLGWLMLLAFVAGACIPAVLSCMRVLWPELVAERDRRDTAYAMLSMQFQVALIVGPLVVSALLLVAQPALAVLVAGVMAGGAGILFAATPASRQWQPPVPAKAVRGSSAGSRTLLVGGVLAGLSAGLIAVGIPAVAVASDAASFAGVLFAALSAGELVGGAAYGARAWRTPHVRRLLGAQLLGTGALLLAAAAAGWPFALLAALAVLGLVLTPAAISSSALLDDVAQAGSLTQAYTSIVAASLVGAAAGNALGGWIVAHFAPWTPFALAAASLAVAALWTAIRRFSLQLSRTAGSTPDD